MKYLIAVIATIVFCLFFMEYLGNGTWEFTSPKTETIYRTTEKIRNQKKIPHSGKFFEKWEEKATEDYTWTVYKLFWTENTLIKGKE